MLKYLSWFGLGAVAIAAACSSNGGNDTMFQSGGTGASAGSGAQGTGGSGAIGSGGSGGSILIDAPSGSGGSTGGTTGSCASGADEDKDQDGWSKNQGDCNDCDTKVNPGAIDVLNTADGGSVWGDEDCDGTPGSSGQTTCDQGLPLDYMDPLNAAKAIELCKTTGPTDKTYGLIEAKWTRADGAAYSPGYNAGIQPSFGPNVNTQAGSSMLAISSGHARVPGQPNACGLLTCMTSGAGTPPAGFPQDSPSCQQSPNINDDIALEVRLRAPTNATGYRFKFRFYSFEYPEWVCTSFNDQFIALVNPAPTGAINGNISFDTQNNPVSVNVAFFDVCPGCPAGTADLTGTGFDVWNDAGATVWLQTQAPVTGGEEISIRFAIWDTGDAAYDSTALIDAFEWIADSGSVDIGTTPVPVPQ
jgi:hypothetical protein